MLSFTVLFSIKTSSTWAFHCFLLSSSQNLPSKGLDISYGFDFHLLRLLYSLHSIWKLCLGHGRARSWAVCEMNDPRLFFPLPLALRKKLGLANSPLAGLEKSCSPFVMPPVRCFLNLHNLYCVWIFFFFLSFGWSRYSSVFLNSSHHNGFRLAVSKHYYENKNNRWTKGHYWKLFVLKYNT